MRGPPEGYGQQGYNPSYESSQTSGSHQSPYDNPQYGYNHGYDPSYEQGFMPSPNLRPDAGPYHDGSPSLPPMSATAYPSGRSTPVRSSHSFASDPFRDPHGGAYGQRLAPGMGQVNPNDIMDDGDDGLEYRKSARNSMLSMGNSSDRGRSAAGAAAGGAAAGGVMGGLMNKNRASYGPVNASATPYQGPGISDIDLGEQAARHKEQSAWAQKEAQSRKRRKIALIALIAIVVIGGIAGGVIGGILTNERERNGPLGGGTSGQTASDDISKNGDLDINSKEIKALLNNKDLHKVFPGVDYTPLNTQFPDCINDPPSQNNITRDVAVLSQLTNTIRLYGTDCNQTQMTIHALRQLKMDKDMKIWLGVWQDNNKTTNARQLSQMWDILDEYGDKPFKGLIVANEILFREQMTTSELGDLLAEVRTNLTSKGMKLPVATSDLGDKWTAELAKVSDYIMANIHPFFGGINAKDAASWTNTFWNNNNGPYFKSDVSHNVISEIGWPSQGGTDCGSEKVTDCPDASVAGIPEMNRLMEDWVCGAMSNGTNYFWFEMFDEPWKISFNTKGKEWEDHWGLMTVDRKLKDGVKIPDCGGKTIGPA